jgi:molecular chaperone GrpE (heat shock protein)
VRVGYSLNGRLLRPASVIVSSGPAKEAAAV